MGGVAAECEAGSDFLPLSQLVMRSRSAADRETDNEERFMVTAVGRVVQGLDWDEPRGDGRCGRETAHAQPGCAVLQGAASRGRAEGWMSDARCVASRYSVLRNGFLESERGDARRQLEDKPPYLALGARMRSAGRAGCPQPAAVGAQDLRARNSLLNGNEFLRSATTRCGRFRQLCQFCQCLLKGGGIFCRFCAGQAGTPQAAPTREVSSVCFAGGVFFSAIPGGAGGRFRGFWWFRWFVLRGGIFFHVEIHVLE